MMDACGCLVDVMAASLGLRFSVRLVCRWLSEPLSCVTLHARTVRIDC